MTERRRSRRSSAKACIKALSGMAKELRSDNELSGFESCDSSVGFRPDSSQSSLGSESSTVSDDVQSNELVLKDEENDDRINSDGASSYSNSSIQRRSQRAKKGAKVSLQNLTLSSFSPIIQYMISCRMRQLKSIRDTCVWYFKQSLDNWRTIFDTKFHPFVFHPSYYRAEFEARQTVLFPSNLSWTPYSLDDPLHCIPGPATSPTYCCHKNPSKYKQLNLFEFDPENSMLYVGGLVQAITWSPPRNRPESELTPGYDSSQPDTAFLAIATLPSPDTRVFYSEPISTRSGLIQVWCCGPLGLKDQPLSWSPSPHIFIAHEWGHVLDLCWLPLSVVMVHPKHELPSDQFRMANARLLFNPFPQISRIAGHLIAACQDGQVRIFAVPRFPLDQVHFAVRRRLPIYCLKEALMLKLSASPDEIPEWVGWPTRLHIRPEYPERLFVGYSSGHVAFYDLSCLNSLFYTASKNHLAPVKLFRLVNGPVISLAQNPLNGRYLIVRGLDLRFAIWDIEDTPALSMESPEISWNVVHGLLGRDVLWTARGDVVFYSREYAFSRRAFTDALGVPLLDLHEIAARGESFVQQTFIDSPHECSRHIVPLGLQSTSSMDFSDSLNALLCATDRGRLELVLNSLDGRVKHYTRNKFMSQLRIPLCQWTLEEIIPESDSTLEMRELKPEPDENTSSGLVVSAPSTNTITENGVSESCPDCFIERAFCSHKLRAQYRLRLHSEKNIPLKPFVDFLKTPYLSITQARFCQDPGSATWLAAGTALGFVQLIRPHYLYLKQFDELLHRTPYNTESPYLSLDSMPVDKGPRNAANLWGSSLVALIDPTSQPRTKPKQSGPTRTKQCKQRSNKFCSGRTIMYSLKPKKSKRPDVSQTRAPLDAFVSSSSGSSDEAAAGTSAAEPLQAVPVRPRRSVAVAESTKRRRKPKRRPISPSSSSLSSLSHSDSDRTVPCTQSPLKQEPP